MGLTDFNIFTERKANLRTETAVVVENRDDGNGNANREGFITYQRYVKTVHHQRSGSKDTKEFLKTTVELKAFWEDLLGFFASFNVHHELSKEQGRQFIALKNSLPKRQFRVVIDHLQRHAIKRGQKETQQEFFAQLGMTLLTVSVTLHVEDACNIPAEEKAALLAFFKAQRKEPIIREEHYYCSHDPERGQAAVQHSLMDLFDYMSGDGRWASQRADCRPSRQAAWDSTGEAR